MRSFVVQNEIKNSTTATMLNNRTLRAHLLIARAKFGDEHDET